jgi:hypothetical protein
MTDDKTFRQLEQQMSIHVEVDADSSLLGEWYESVRDKRIVDFSVDDLCIACRQGLFLDFLLPVIADRLGSDPLAGTQYDGELLISLKHIPREYWNIFHNLATRVKSAINSIGDHLDSDLKVDIAALSEKISEGEEEA